MRSRIIILCVALLVVLIGAGMFLRTRSPGTAEPVVKIGYFQQHLGSVPLFLAEEKGIFAKHGIQAELVPMASSNQATDALVRGDIDFGIISLIPVLNAETKDPGKIQLVSASVITRESQFDRVIAKADSGITSLMDPRIQKIAVFPGTTASNFLKAQLARQGVDATKIEFVQMPPQNQLPALESGAVQAAHMLEPLVTLTLEKDGYVAISGSVYAEVFNQSPIGGYAISSKFVKEHPELAKKLADVVHEASDYQLAHPDEAKQVIAQRFQVAPEVAQKMNLLPFARFDALAPDFLSSFADVLLDMGELTTKPGVNAMVYRASR